MHTLMFTKRSFMLPKLATVWIILRQVINMFVYRCNKYFIKDLGTLHPFVTFFSLLIQYNAYHRRAEELETIPAVIGRKVEYTLDSLSQASHREKDFIHLHIHTHSQ